MLATGTTQIQGQTLPVEIERVFVLPDKMFIDAMLAKQFRVTVAVDGKKGWQLAPTQTGKMEVVEFKGKDIDQALFEAWREPELLLLKANDKSAKLLPAKDEELDGKPHAVVKIESPFGVELLIYIDKKTKLISRISFSQGGTQVDEFSDYKDVGGIKVAHKRKSQGQGRVTQLEITKVEWDPKVDDLIFAVPAQPAAPAPPPSK
jgi:hypothetical protein